MAVNPKSLENLKKHTTEELKAYGSYGGRVKAQKQRERKAAANAAIEAAAILNKALPKDLKKELDELISMDEPTYRTYALGLLLAISREGAKDSDRITAIKSLFEYAREDPDYELKMKELEIKKQRADNEEF